MAKSRSIECKCDDSFTCRHCLNQVVYHFTPSTNAEILHRQQEEDRKKMEKTQAKT